MIASFEHRSFKLKNVRYKKNSDIKRSRTTSVRVRTVLNCYHLFNTESRIDKNKFAVWWVGEGVAGRTDKQSLIIVEPVHFAVFIVTTISALVATRPLDKNWRPDKQRLTNHPPVWVPRPLGTRGRFIPKSLPSCPRATAELIFFSVSSGEQWVLP